MKTLLLALLSFFIFSNSIDCVAEYVMPGTEEKVIDKKTFWNIESLKDYRDSYPSIKLDCGKKEEKKNSEMGMGEFSAWFFGIIGTVVFIIIFFAYEWYSFIFDLFVLTTTGTWKFLKKSYQYINKKFGKKKKFEDIFPEIIYYEKGDVIHYKNDQGMVAAGEYMGAFEDGTIAVVNRVTNESNIVDYKLIVENKNYNLRKINILKKQLDGDYYNIKLKAMREINEDN